MRQIHRLFEALTAYYRSDVDLAEALGMRRETVAEWRDTPPARPRRETVARIGRLLFLCRSARAFMADDQLVGDWTLTAQPSLVGETPASVLLRLHDEGLWGLVTQLEQLVPRRRFDQADPVGDEELMTALVQGLGVDVRTELEKMRVEPLNVDEADLAEII